MDKIYISSNWLVRRSFIWACRYVARASKIRALAAENMLLGFPSEQCGPAASKLERHAPFNLFRSTQRVFCFKLAAVALFALLTESLSIFVFWSFSGLVHALQASDDSLALLWAISFSLSLLLSILLRNNYFLSNARAFVVLREAITARLFRKYMRLSLSAEASEGAMLNAATGDLAILDLGHYYLIHLFFEPIVALLYLVFFYVFLGPPVVFGFLAILLAVLLQAPVAWCLTRIRTSTLALTEQRLTILY